MEATAFPIDGIVGIGIVAMAVLVPPLSLVVQWRYRRAVRRSMMRSAGAEISPPPPGTAAPGAPPQLFWSILDNRGSAADLDESEHAAAVVRSRTARTVAVHVGAAVVYGVLAGALYLAANDLAFSAGRLFVSGALLAWPVLPTVLHVIGARTRLGALVTCGYLVLVIVPGTLLGASWLQMLVLAAITTLPPALIVLALTHHSLRAVGPFLAPGVLLAGVGFSVWPWLALELIPILGTGAVGTARLWPPLGVLVNRPSVLQVVASAIVLSILCGLALLLAFGNVRWVARRYERRSSSDRSLLADQWWLIAALWFGVTLLGADLRYAPLPVFALLAHRAATAFGMRVALRGSPRAPNTRLLLLRTFGARRRSERLLRDVTRSWSYLGTVQLIAGPDLATASLQPHEFLDFVRGRLARRFVRDGRDLDARLAARDDRPDRDGRYRVEEYFCHDDTWRATVQRLARDSSVVLLDLRGFTIANRGVAYELGALVELYPLQRVVLAVDDTTDASAVREVLERAWQTMRADSPNRARPGTTVRVLRLDHPPPGRDPLLLALGAAARPVPQAEAWVASEPPPRPVPPAGLEAAANRVGAG